MAKGIVTISYNNATLEHIKQGNEPDGVNMTTVFAAAFAMTDAGDKVQAQGSQLLAYGLMVEHDRMVQRGAVVAAWGALVYSPAAKRDFLHVIKERYSIGASHPSKGEGFNMERIRHNATENAHTQALSRAFNLAAALAACNVTPADYDLKQRYFTIPLSAILPRDAAPIGNATRETRVALDGAPHGYAFGEGYSKFSSVRATVSQIERIFTGADAKKKEKKADKPEAGAVTLPSPNGEGAYTTKPVSIKRSGDSVTDFNALILEAEKTISVWEDDESLPTPSLAAFPPEVRNALAHLAAFYDAAAQADAARKAADEQAARAAVMAA